MESENKFTQLRSSMQIGSKEYNYFSLKRLSEQYPQVNELPISIRILLECAIRNCDEFSVKSEDVMKIIDWKSTSQQDVEIPFKPGRVILQDFTGVPAVVDLAGMRDAVQRLDGDPQKINPLCPVDLVIDHSVQVDFSRTLDSKEKNEEIEFSRNYQRFEFLKWGQQAFDNFLIVPPGSGIVHQVNLEYLARVVFDSDGMLYPDSVVGTDSHTTMINGLGVLGWGVGGIEAEAVMMGQNISMVLPQVVGFKLTGQLNQMATATDLVLTCVQMLRQRGVVGKFVEFFGEGVASLSLADRATISNMAPEYGATMGFFAIDQKTIDYLQLTNRSDDKIQIVQQYLKEQNLFIDCPTDYDNIQFSGNVISLDLNTIEPCVSGPKRPHDRVTLQNMKTDFNSCLNNKQNNFKGFGYQSQQKIDQKVEIEYENEKYILDNGSLVIASITSCTNTSNPDVILQAALLAKNAIEKGLKVKPYIKTSLSPGSGVVEKYLSKSGLQQYFDQLGFNIAGYGCMTCIGNSGELDEIIHQAIQSNDLCVAAVLSGNRNFEARVHQLTKANYLASPPLVVAYALAGTVNMDFQLQPIGQDTDGQDVYLKDIWPTREQVIEVSTTNVKPEMFKSVYDKISKGTERWNNLQIEKSLLYNWKDENTYINNPPFFKQMQKDAQQIQNIENAYCLAVFGDSITTDHISPAGKIALNSPAAIYLQNRNVSVKDFNTYGARRGNDEVMARGTFANTRIINKMMNGKVGPSTVHVPTSEVMPFFDAAQKYQQEQQQTIILAGNEYGSGSSRDWAAKGPYLLGVKLVIAQSYERIHRSNLVGMGILPCQFIDDQSSDSLGLNGTEQYSVQLNNGDIKVNQILTVSINNGKTFQVKCRLDTDVEVEYFKNQGILQYVLRNLIKK